MEPHQQAFTVLPPQPLDQPQSLPSTVYRIYHEGEDGTLFSYLSPLVLLELNSLEEAMTFAVAHSRLIATADWIIRDETDPANPVEVFRRPAATITLVIPRPHLRGLRCGDVESDGSYRFLLRHTEGENGVDYGCAVLLTSDGQVFDRTMFRYLRETLGAWIECDRRKAT